MRDLDQITDVFWSALQNRRIALYHGPAEQHETLAVMAERGGVDASAFNIFFRKLGGLKWDLGGVRSYAMVLANLIGKPSSPITMIDDDIVVLPHARKVSAIDTLEQDVLDNPRLLTGGTLKGSPDESSIETAIRMICRFIGSRKHLFSSEMPMPISGGLLTFNSTCSHLYPFPRWYNEDWAWLAQYQARGYSIRVERRVVAKHLSSRKNLNRIIELLSAMEIPLAEAQLKLGQRRTGVRPILRLLKHTKNYVASIKPIAMMRRYSRYLKGVKRWRCFIKAARRCEMNFDLIGGRV